MLIQRLAAETAQADSFAIARRIDQLVRRNRASHGQECFNHNPGTNVMNPRAEALLASGIGNRPSLGYPGEKYEMGVEAIEEIEVFAAELCAEILAARYAEIRLASGAMRNLYAFMATCEPGDVIIAPPSTIGGCVTHHRAGCAGLFELKTHPAPVDADGYTEDVDALGALALGVRPKIITIGGCLNPSSRPLREIRAIADELGAKILFDAVHQWGIIAGRVWPNPLAEGAHLMTMSSYKRIGGSTGSLIVTSDARLAKKLEAIAFPGKTANFDAAKSAALALTMLDWREYGQACADVTVRSARAFAEALDAECVPVFLKARGFTRSHQFAVEAARHGGGQAASKKPRKAGFLACGIGLPDAPVDGGMNGLRTGTPELVRWGVAEDDIPAVASFVARGPSTDEPEAPAPVTTALRAEFTHLSYVVS